MMSVCVLAVVDDGPRVLDSTAPLTLGEVIVGRLDAMEEAVEAADAVTFLGSISQADAVFFQEQKNWARDWERKPVADVEFDVDQGSIVLGDEGRAADADVTMSWTLEESPRERRVSWRVRFLLAESGDWLYAGKAWEELEAEALIVLFEPGMEKIAEQVVEIFPEIREHVNEGFEVNLKHQQHIKIYPDMPQLQASIYLSYTDPLGGWNEPGESIKILPSGFMGKRGLKILIAHEYGHVATFAMGEKSRDMPWWAAEGVAELAAERFSDGARRARAQVEGWAASGSLVAWEKLSDFENFETRYYPFVYAQGHHMVGFISEHWGRGQRNQWIALLTQGVALDDATSRALGISFEELDRQWRASLGVESDN